MGPFGGLQTALDEEYTANPYSRDNLNVDLTNGLDQRLGYAESDLTAALASVTGIKGHFYLEGYDSDLDFVSEYLSFIEVSGELRVYTTDPATNVRTRVTDGGTPVTCTDGEWQAFVFKGQAYAFTPHGPVYVHDIGDDESWYALDQGQPNQFITNNYPLMSFVRKGEQTEPGAGSFDFTGFVGTTHLSDFSGGFPFFAIDWVSTTGDVVRLNASTTGAGFGANFKMESPAAPVDFSAAKFFTFEMYREDGLLWFKGLHGDPLLGGVEVRVEDAGATSILTTVEVTPYNLSNNPFAWEWRYRIKCTIADADRGGAVISAAEKLHIQCAAPKDYGEGHNIDFYVTSPIPDEVAAPPDPGELTGIRFGVVGWNEIFDVEATNPTFSKEYNIDTEAVSAYFSDTDLDGDGFKDFLGNEATVTIPATQLAAYAAASNVTKLRLYVAFMDEGTEAKYTMRYMGEIEKATATYVVPYNYEELRALPLRKDQEYNAVGNVVAGGTFRGSAVWGKEGGLANIQHTKVGEAGIVAKDTDNSDPEADFVDEFRGATFTLATNAADEAVAFFGALDSFIILGRRSVHVQRGQTPITLTPPKEVAGSFGCPHAGAACRWKDDAGRMAVLYLDNSLQRLWMVTVEVVADVENDERMVEVSLPVRDVIRNWLFDGTLPMGDDILEIRMVPDWRNDRVMLWYGNKALVIDKPSLTIGQRPYVKYEFAEPDTDLTFARFAECETYGFRSLLSDSSMRELFYEYGAGAFTPIDGADRDGGTTPPASFWKSPVFDGNFRHVGVIQIQKRTTSELVTLDCSCVTGGVTATQTLGEANREKDRGHPTTAGFDLQYTITLPDNSDGVTRVVVQEVEISTGRHF